MSQGYHENSDEKQGLLHERNFLAHREAKPSQRLNGKAHYQLVSVFRPAKAGTRSEVGPHRSEYRCSYQRPDQPQPGSPATSGRSGQSALMRSKVDQCRVVIVVVETTHLKARQ
jgi:hypothetical protein